MPNPIFNPDDAAQLPSYITRHFKLGFDADDVSALISSIDASQGCSSTSSLPHLPAEILFQIVSHVSIDHILQWRLVCRGFRDCIDGPVMHDCISRAQLIRIESHSALIWAGLPPDFNDTIGQMECTFNRLEDSTLAQKHTNPKWGALHAVFSIDEEWRQELDRAEAFLHNSGQTLQWEHLIQGFHMQTNESGFGSTTWCMRLGTAVLDLSLCHQELREKVKLDFSNWEVKIEWKSLLSKFIRTETQLKVMMEQKPRSGFTYSLQEDCLRDLRRRRLRAVLERNPVPDSLVLWRLSTLQPLFGMRGGGLPVDQHLALWQAEDDAMDFLMTARKEAAMSRNERNRLMQLSKDYNDMIAELEKIEKQYTGWRSTVFESELVVRSLPSMESKNPFAWDDAVIRKRTAQVLRWKAQRENMQQVARLLEASVEAVCVPEDAFDELGSDI